MGRGSSGKTDLAEFLLKLGFTRMFTDGPRIKFGQAKAHCQYHFKNYI